MGVLADLVARGQNAPRILGDVVYVADIVVEMRARLGHAIEMFGLEQRPFEFLALLHFVEFPIRQGQGRLESVLDLPAVPVAGRSFFIVRPMVVGEFADLFFREVDLKAGFS